MQSDSLRLQAQGHAQQLGEINDLHTGLDAQCFLGANLVHFQSTVTGRALGGDDFCTGGFGGLQYVGDQKRGSITVRQRMSATTAGRLEWELNATVDSSLSRLNRSDNVQSNWSFFRGTMSVNQFMRLHQVRLLLGHKPPGDPLVIEQCELIEKPHIHIRRQVGMDPLEVGLEKERIE